MKPNIAIDGPAGAGKSTIAKLLARQLELLYIDTGAMYRALALKVLQMGIMPEEVEKIIAVAENTAITLVENQDKSLCIFLDGTDVTEEIRLPEVTALVSTVAAIPAVRLCMVEQQRKIAERGGVIMDGRDIGTFVLPQAELKFFVTASSEERAKRRYLELAAKGLDVQLEQIAQQISSRDAQDENRALAPLKKAQDAILIDTTGLDIENVLEKMISYWGEY